MNDLVLMKLDAARTMLAEAKTIQETKKILDVAAAAEIYAKRQQLGADAILYATSIKVEALRQLGNMLKETPRAEGGRPLETGTQSVPVYSPPTLADMGLDKKTSKLAQDIAALPDTEIEKVKQGIVTLHQAQQESRREVQRQRVADIAAQPANRVQGLFDVIVIDPPWTMQKIEREVRPNQVGFDYPVMSLDELKALEIPCADDCHVWLWTTQKYLPYAFDLLATWDLIYVCTMVWHKPGGFQPVYLPQYNCEFALYAHKGNPRFVETKAFMTCFDAPRGAHSEKPQAFYDVIRRVTAGRRLDMFNRRAIDGFEGWGNESKRLPD